MAGRAVSLETAGIYAEEPLPLHAASFPEARPADEVFGPPELEAIYVVRRSEVIRFLVGYGLDLVEAEDITQEVFLNALREPERRRAADHFCKWLLVCAKNIAINCYRRRRREVQAPTALWKRWEDTLADGACDQEITLEQRERFEKFRRALSQLTAAEQQSVLLRGEGSTFREIAEALDIPLRSAIHITGMALRKLQRRLGSA